MEQKTQPPCLKHHLRRVEAISSQPKYLHCPAYYGGRRDKATAQSEDNELVFHHDQWIFVG